MTIWGKIMSIFMGLVTAFLIGLVTGDDSQKDFIQETYCTHYTKSVQEYKACKEADLEKWIKEQKDVKKN